MDEKEIRQKELEAILTVYYTAGFSKQPRLFGEKEDEREVEKEFQALTNFNKLIEEEANKRKIRPLELIRYFAENKEELIRLLEKKSIKKLLPKFSKIYTHSEMEDIMNDFLNTQRLQDKGIKNLYNDSISGAVKTWEGKGVDYIVNVDDLIKLAGKPPKVFVSQIKNLLLLMGIIQEQQFKNSTKEPRCEFKLSYYAERRGYTKEEIAKGGNFFNELKRDLLSGAITSFGKILIKGKKYTVYNSFYALYEPEDSRDNWIVEFNNPYGDLVMQILNKQARQYFIKSSKALEDRASTDKPYLFLFYQQLIRRKQYSLVTKPVKIGNLLADMHLPDKILTRPKECFELLKECLIYFSNHYKPIPEIENFSLYNDFHKTKTIKLPLNISEAFKNYGYEDFKGLLGAIGVKDVREAYISFKRPYKKPKRKHELNEQETEMLNRTLKWFNGQVTKIPINDQESMIGMYIKKLGYDNYRELFEREANKSNVNAVEFLTRVLPDELREYKLLEI